MSHRIRQMRGWISLHRKILENPVIPTNEELSKFEAWIWLLLNANHKEGKVVIGNDIHIVNIGERITSIKKLCTTFGWGNTKVRNFLKLLSKDEMIRYESTSKMTRISICNYSTYQSSQHKRNTPTTRKQHKGNMIANTNNNDKIINNNDKIIEFESWWTDYPKKLGKEKAKKAFLNLNNFQRKNATDKLDSHKRHWINSDTEMQFIPFPATWLNQGRYDDELETKSIAVTNRINNQHKEGVRRKKEREIAEQEKATSEEIRQIIEEGLAPSKEK